MPDVRLAFRPFQQQLDSFRRKVNVPSARWDDLLREDHAHGFMVAGLARMDVLDDIRSAIVAAQQSGETLADFRARFDEIVRGKWEGWTGSESEAGRAWRTRVIYQTNLRTSYMAGRWEQLQRFPYLRYQHNTVANPREEHQAWDGRIIATNDPWWDTHYPPNGWGCRCTVTGVSEARLRAFGKSGPDGAPPAGVGDPPPEWAYHVGKASRSLPAAAAFGAKVMQLPDAWRAAALADAQRRSVDLLFDWPRMVENLYERAVAGVGDVQTWAAPVGFIRPAVAGSLQAAGYAQQTALLAAVDRDILHSMRDAKASSTRFGRAPRDPEQLRGMIADLLEDLPRRLSLDATSVFLDARKVTGQAGLVFATRLESGQWIKYVFSLDETRQVRRHQVAAVWLKTVETTTVDELHRMQLLDGPAP